MKRTLFFGERPLARNHSLGMAITRAGGAAVAAAGLLVAVPALAAAATDPTATLSQNANTVTWRIHGGDTPVTCLAAVERTKSLPLKDVVAGEGWFDVAAGENRDVVMNVPDGNYFTLWQCRIKMDQFWGILQAKNLVAITVPAVTTPPGPGSGSPFGSLEDLFGS